MENVSDINVLLVILSNLLPSKSLPILQISQTNEKNQAKQKHKLKKTFLHTEQDCLTFSSEILVSH